MLESFEVLETGGFISAVEAMRFPTQSAGDSRVEKGIFILGENDAKLAKSLLSKSESINEKKIFQGDTHGKFTRSIVAWIKCTATRALWSELDTYVVGVAPTSSTSTMYTLKKEYKNGTWRDNFHDKTPQRQIDGFDEMMKAFIKKYGDVKSIPIDELKYGLPEGFMQTRTKMFSYQSLRRLYLQRHKHRLPEWHTFCREIEKLPYFKELIEF